MTNVQISINEHLLTDLGAKEKNSMPRILKIRCNGKGEHINEIDLDKALQPTIVVRGWFRPKRKEIPERLVLHCQHCAEGRVVIPREIIEEHLRESSG